ncbi:MAG: hypothetical protein HY905_01990 [Deltaproteobacteria bacterium]|nr:hypothetical protein [Deltaproteobacteria bacterium]
MKVGPKMPGAVGPGNVTGPESGKETRGAGKAEGAGKFAEALGPRPSGPSGVAAAAPAPEAVADVAARYAAGELTRAEAAREVAAAAVRSWPAGFDDEGLRARAVEDMADFLTEDPSFSALLDAATARTE